MLAAPIQNGFAATLTQVIQNLVTAIGNLNPGQKLALCKNFGGSKK